MRLGSVITLSVEGVVGKGQGSGIIQAPGEGRGWTHAGSLANARASGLVSWRQKKKKENIYY